MGQFEPTERQQPQVVMDYTRWFLARLRRWRLRWRRANTCALAVSRQPMWRWAMPLLLAQHLGLAPQFGPATQALAAAAGAARLPAGHGGATAGRLWSKACPPPCAPDTQP